MENPPNEAEREQSREQIEVLLKEALEKKLVVDLVIEDRIPNQPNMIVEGLEGDVVYFSYIDEDGELGEGNIPLQINLVRKVVIKGPFQQSQG